MAEARAAYRAGQFAEMKDENSYTYKFGLSDGIRELGDVLSNGDWSTSFMGGYDVEISNIESTKEYNIVEIRVANVTGWQSATRVWGWSFKQNEARREPGPGGNMSQTYTWREAVRK